MQTVAGSLAVPAAWGQSGSRKPNIIVILADDLGYGDLSSFGGRVPTPNIDSIGKSGVRFTSAYVTAPVCSPSRAGFLTGRYQQRCGHEHNTGPAKRDLEEKLGLPLSETTLPQVMKSAGYRTGMVGKWHLGMTPEFHPMSRGFDEYFGFTFAAHNYIDPAQKGVASIAEAENGRNTRGPGRDALNPILRGRERVTEDEYLTDAFSREATGFIDRNKKNPFFLYLPYNAIHAPWQATEKYLDRFANVKDEKARVLAAMTSALDDGVGRVLKSVKDNGLEKDTMVVFFSDNGAPIYLGAGSNGPLTGSKLTHFEGGLRIPMLMKYPAAVPAGKTYEHAVSSLNLFPTIAALGGAAPPADRKLDGVDLIPYLTGKNKGLPNETLFWRNGPNSAMRKGNWKLMIPGEGALRLYDLAKDIGEKNNLAEANADVVKRLTAELNQWKSELKDPLWKPVQYVKFPYGGETISWTV